MKQGSETRYNEGMPIQKGEKGTQMLKQIRVAHEPTMVGALIGKSWFFTSTVRLSDA